METKQEKGFNYEIQVRNHIINTFQKQAYLWNDSPETLLIKAGIIGSHNENRLRRKENKENRLQDTGIDIIQVDNDVDNIISFVQCKNGYKNGITYNDLAGFSMWMMNFENINGYVYYTNKLSNHITSFPRNKRIEYIKLPYIENINREQSTHSIKPFDYQITARNNFEEYFKSYDRGILSMPCGTGKTFTSYLISQNYKQIIIISPLKQFAKQNLDRYIEYGYKLDNTLLVDSDGERDIKQIEKFIKEKKSFVISSTFCSVDVIYQVLKFMNQKELLIIVDEFHNISKTNMINEDDNFNKILYSQYRILFMSATPRVYEMEENDNDDDNINDEIFGEIVYKMTFNEAIEKKYITDYRIWLPSIHEDTSKLNNELNIYEIDSVIKAKCMFLFSCLLNNGSKKCIIYCNDNNEISLMKDAMNLLNEFFILDYEISQITATDSENKRKNILNNFEDSNKIQLLFSIRILDECIDIPKCDSIYITYPSKTKVRTIQRICRCIRNDKNNTFKIGNIYIWCNEYDKILDTLSGIKEYDIFFKDKIKINESNFFGKEKDDSIKEDLKLIEKYILEIKEFRILSWENKLEEVKKYIDENNKRPCAKNNNIKVRRCGEWVSNQLKYYNKNEHIMKNNKNIRKLWEDFINHEKYNKYFSSNESEWILKLEEIKKYIDENNRKPSSKDKNDKVKSYGLWLCRQNNNYKNNDRTIKVDNIRKLWEDFINDDKYKKYFVSDEDIWKYNLNLVKKYIDKNNRKPTPYDEDLEIQRFGIWILSQRSNYKNNEQIMKNNKEINKLWSDFINDVKYKKYFLTDEEEWKLNLDKLKKYIEENKKKPSTTDKNKDIKSLSHWISRQHSNYKNNKSIMEDENIKKLWENFISDDKYTNFKHILSNEEEWKLILKKVKKYIDDNNKKPSLKDENIEIRRYKEWINTQKKNYKKSMNIMKDENIKKLWNDFFNDIKYKKYFNSD